MTNQDASTIAHSWLDAFNSSDWEKAKAYLAPNSVYEEYGTQRHIEGSDAIVELYQAWKAAMPDVSALFTMPVIASLDAVLIVEDICSGYWW